MIKKCTLIAAIVTTAALMGLGFTSNLPFENPYGCDPFGYHRQASLFDKVGIRAGLNTEIESPETSLLIKVASRLDENISAWSTMIAPHCHHYDARSQKVIAQYPPGTGFFLALMPDGKRLQALTALMVLSIVVLYAAVNYLALSVKFYIISTASFYIAIETILKLQSSSYSIPASVFLIAILVSIFALGKSASIIKNCIVVALLGVLTGLLVTVRIASIVFVPLVLLLINFNLNRNNLSIRNRKELAACSLGMLVSAAPLLIANKINAGGYLNSTYSGSDTEFFLIFLYLFET